MPKIVTRMIPDWIEPYKSFGERIPVVINSDHPRFKPLSRLDWGFIRTALSEGYDVEIIHA